MHRLLCLASIPLIPVTQSTLRLIDLLPKVCRHRACVLRRFDHQPRRALHPLQCAIVSHVVLVPNRLCGRSVVTETNPNALEFKDSRVEECRDGREGRNGTPSGLEHPRYRANMRTPPATFRGDRPMSFDKSGPIRPMSSPTPNMRARTFPCCSRLRQPFGTGPCAGTALLRFTYEHSFPLTEPALPSSEDRSNAPAYGSMYIGRECSRRGR